jgi:hypothetical protein
LLVKEFDGWGGFAGGNIVSKLQECEAGRACTSGHKGNLRL